MRRGVSFIELLIVLAVLSALLGIAAPAMLPLAREQAFDSTASMIGDVIVRAQSEVVRTGEARAIVVEDSGDGCVIGMRGLDELRGDGGSQEQELAPEGGLERVLLRIDPRLSIEMVTLDEADGTIEEETLGTGDESRELKQVSSFRIGILLPSGGAIATEAFELRDGERRSAKFQINELTGTLRRVARQIRDDPGEDVLGGTDG